MVQAALSVRQTGRALEVEHKPKKFFTKFLSLLSKP
jgi:hypothetical protein